MKGCSIGLAIIAQLSNFARNFQPSHITSYKGKEKANVNNTKD
jgi:hypothetical protein